MKRLLALLLSVLMVAGLLAGCSGGEEETTSTEPSSTTSTEPSTAPSYEAPIDDSEVDYEIELPLTESGESFTYWVVAFTFEDMAGMEDNLFFQWMEDQTGVHIDFLNQNYTSVSESFQTMILSNDYPDFVQDFKNYYSGGVDKAISDGFVIPLNDLVDEYMPNYRKVVYRDEETFMQCVSDSGNLWGVHRISDRAQGASTGMGVRSDWLDRAGLTVEDCETMEGFGNVLRTFKEYTYENEGPLYLAMGGIPGGGALSACYNITSPVLNNAGFLNKNGVAANSMLEPNMKAFIGQMADWYAEGLVNENYIADANYAVPEDRWVNSEVGAGTFTYVNVKSYAANAANSELVPSPDFDLAAITAPKMDASQNWETDAHVRVQEDVVQSANSCGITTACENLELACKWWDYQWTEDGMRAANWGPYEGEYGDSNATYYVDETDANGDGIAEAYQPWLLEKYGSIFLAQIKVARHMAPNYNIWSREWSVLTPKEINYQFVWETAGCDWWWPTSVTLTADEGAEASAILTACQTAFSEWSAKVITGELSIDTYDTELVPQLEGMNIARAIELYQAALDRYVDRAQYLD